MPFTSHVVHTMVLVWLALCWLGYPHLLRLIGRWRTSIDVNMLAMRRVWMTGLLQRDFRVPDTMLMGHVIHSVAFFASGTIIVVGALAQVNSLAAFSEGFTLGKPASPESIRLAACRTWV
jgi:uncharacterized membrane protein